MSEPSIPEQEEALLRRVRTHLLELTENPPPSIAPTDYGKQLIELRDEISEARLEDVPALVAQMERLSGVAARRAEVQTPPVDVQAPYFARLRLRENGRDRDVLLGRTTYIDSTHGVRIVDWRHAPVSQLYYRYPEGAHYEETFGDRDVQGEILLRRTVTIAEGDLLRIQAPQGIFVKRTSSSAEAQWHQLDARTIELSGGQGQAIRPHSVTRGSLGIGPDGQQRTDRHLPEIAALLDARQFELISAADTGVVVIQGGAGSGKTTIGLHRIAYLAFHNPKRFSPDKVLIVTYGVALGAYISAVLPALGVPGVRVESFTQWAETQRKIAVPWLAMGYDENTPPAVTRLKKHPALLHLLTRRAREIADKARNPLGSRAVVSLWAEVLTDLPALQQAMERYGDGAIGAHDVTLAHRWCTEHCATILENDPRDGFLADDDDGEDGVDDDRKRGIDGRGVHEEEGFGLDREDDALFLRLHQLLVGPLRKARQPLVYEHIFVDEAQDLSPVELAVLFGTISGGRSVTLAGDTAQRLYFDNGFRDWRSTLDDLGLSATDIEPLRIAYRSTKEVLEVARAILGPLADAEPPLATRSGAPVEVHSFPQTGAAVAFLADALRGLLAREPRATVGILSRFSEQADAYYEGLVRSEIPYVRRVRAQDFSFRPGVDVTEIHQVKGLEFDYVILVDVNEPVFPANDEARHLLHIAATRAAHQLWFLVTGAPSPLLPNTLVG